MVEKRIITGGEKPLEVLLNVHMQLKQQIFNTTSILLLITSLIFSLVSGFFINQFTSLVLLIKIAGAVLITSSIITIILCLSAITPKLRHRKPETEFYFMDVLGLFGNKEKYLKRMKKLISDDEETIKFFIDEYWELGEKVLLPDFKKINFAISILVIGLLLFVLLFALSFIFPVI